MVIDIILLVFIVMGTIKGYRQGIIKSVFTVASLIIGILLALKFSYLASDYISSSFDVPPKWLPILSFAVVMLAALGIVQLLGKGIESLLKAIQLNFLNRVGGIVLWVGVSILKLSVIVWLVNQTGIIKPEVKAASVSYPFLESFAPQVVHWLGEIFPPAKDIFNRIEDLFEKWSSIKNFIPGS